MKSKVSNYLLIITSLYLTLIICDWIVKKINYRFLNEASRIKLETYIENKIKKKEAFKSGFKFTIYPQTIEDSLNLFDENANTPPLASLINSNSFLCDEGYGLIKYKTDKFGFRNKNDIYENPIDIILIGDSFAHGACIDDEYSIANILNQKFNVLNLGIGSTNPTHYALNLNIFEEHFKPKKIITIFYSNDYEFNENSIYEKIYKKKIKYFDQDSFVRNKPTKYNKNVNNTLKLIEKEFLLKMQSKLDNKVLNQKKKSFLEGKFYTLFYHLRLLEMRKMFLIISKKYSQEYLPKNTIRMIQLLKERCNLKVGCQPLAILIPSSDYWDYDYRGKIYLKNLKKILTQNEIDFLDFSNKSNDKDFYAPKGIHLSIEGNAIISEKILNKIM